MGVEGDDSQAVMGFVLEGFYGGNKVDGEFNVVNIAAVESEA